MAVRFWEGDTPCPTPTQPRSGGIDSVSMSLSNDLCAVEGDLVMISPPASCQATFIMRPAKGPERFGRGSSFGTVRRLLFDKLTSNEVMLAGRFGRVLKLAAGPAADAI